VPFVVRKWLLRLFEKTKSLAQTELVNVLQALFLNILVRIFFHLLSIDQYLLNIGFLLLCWRLLTGLRSHDLLTTVLEHGGSLTLSDVVDISQFKIPHEMVLNGGRIDCLLLQICLSPVDILHEDV
jgi:hypothetical protein